MIRIAICDDDIKLTSDIEQLIYNHEVIHKFDIDVFFSGEELLKSIKNNEYYDLLFLDVEMGEINGIDTAHEIRKLDKNVLIIYVTSYARFAPSAFEVNAFRFLQKPIDEDKFKKYYSLAINEIIKKPIYFRFAFKRENFKILFSDILYFESMQRQTFIYKNKGDPERCYMKLQEVEDRLSSSNIFFYRISQSLLVNPEHVYSYMYNRMILKDGTELQVAVNRREKVTELFCKIKGGELID